MLDGVSKVWSWDLNGSVRHVDLEVVLAGATPATATIYNDVQAYLRQDGQVVSQNQGSIYVGGGTASIRFLNYDVAAKANETLTDHAGSWELELTGAQNPVDWSVTINARW